MVLGKRELPDALVEPIHLSVRKEKIIALHVHISNEKLREKERERKREGERKENKRTKKARERESWADANNR